MLRLTRHIKQTRKKSNNPFDKGFRGGSIKKTLNLENVKPEDGDTLTPKSFKATPVVALEADQSSKVAAAQDRLLRMKFLELNKKTKLF